MDYTELAKRMEEGGICKCVCRDYVIYKRSWLYDHIEQEAVLIKSAREIKPMADGITRLKEFLKEQEKGKHEDGKSV